MHVRVGAQQSHALVSVEVARVRGERTERTVDLQLLSGLGGNGLDAP